MNVSAFSISLTVKALAASRAFYEAFGFTASGGDLEQGWLILRIGNHVIGLFPGDVRDEHADYQSGWNQDCEQPVFWSNSAGTVLRPLQFDASLGREVIHRLPAAPENEARAIETDVNSSLQGRLLA